MIPFQIQRASSVEQAISSARGGARYLAGGTTLYDLMREEVEQPTRIVDINAVPLAQIRLDGDTLVIGALARMADVAAHPEVRQVFPLVAESLLEGASPQLRNMASMGGNLLQRVRCPYFRMHDAACNKRLPNSGCSALEGLNAGCAVLGTSEHCIATHPSDVAVAFVALDAVMTVQGPRGHRTFPVEELFRLPGSSPHLEHTLEPAELIVEIRVPTGPHTKRARYLKVRDRASYEFALVAAAVALHVEGNVIRDARIACGGVGTRPWRMREAEQILIGQRPSTELFARAGDASTTGARPRHGNAYKVPLLARTVKRSLEMAMEVPA
jgi:Aerobic-type carbon monoxide dehydrogenase, middle subunit CoxM/CutM homologs